MTFVYLNFTESMGRNIAMLGATLIIACIQRARWIQARALILGSCFISVLSFKWSGELIPTPEWFYPEIGLFLAMLSFLWTSFYFFNHFKITMMNSNL